MCRFKFFVTLCWTLALIAGSLRAEIVQVQVAWEPLRCTLSCAQLLAAQLQKVPGVALITMNVQSGYAQLQWKPGFPFVYANIHAATQAVGLGTGYRNNIHVTVRGLISFQQNTAILTSIGDNTVFYLLGPYTPLPNQTSASYFNISNYALSPALVQQLYAGAQQNSTAVIEGALFAPWRYPNNMLIIESLQFETQNAQVTPQPIQTVPQQTVVVPGIRTPVQYGPIQPLSPPQPQTPSR